MSSAMVSGIPSTPTEAASAARPHSSPNTVNPLANQQTFLNLLVTQLKNQDPLNPMDGTAFVSQLTEFSGLEQLLSINNGVQSMLELLRPPETTGGTEAPSGS